MEATTIDANPDARHLVMGVEQAGNVDIELSSGKG
jgi:hypothetical protein